MSKLRAGAACRVRRWNHYTERNVIEKDDLWVYSSRRAHTISAVSTWGLKNVFRRPAANFPGKIALYVDPRLIADLAPRLEQGSVCVVGTNGKTTVTNLLADALELAGQRVVCNRTGANLDSGVATSLLHAGWKIG